MIVEKVKEFKINFDFFKILRLNFYYRSDFLSQRHSLSRLIPELNREKSDCAKFLPSFRSNLFFFFSDEIDDVTYLNCSSFKLGVSNTRAV